MSAVLAERQLTLDEILGPHWRDLAWRIAHLYWIVDESGKAIKFDPNDEQRDFIEHLHTRNLILKARQLGFSTLLQILELDQAIFNANHNGVVIADTLPNAGRLFAKIEFAYERLPDSLKAAMPLKSQASKSSLEFEHGSTINVSTSSRGGTVQLLHISELGKIARKYPDRAQEIVSGAFESVPQDGVIVVESTAEGAAGEFFELVDTALKRQEEGAPETPLDWRLHFYPWYLKAAYRLDPELVIVSDQDNQYFDKVQVEAGVTVDPGQRAWYVKKRESLGRLMKREYPSTPREAFEQAVEGAVFGEEMTAIREAGRITTVPLDVNYPVNTFWDFGLGARNPIWLHQRIGLQNRWVKYFDDFGKGLAWWWRTLEKWRIEHGEFMWGTHYLPHDADTEILGENVTTKHRILVAAGMRNTFVVPRVALKDIAIDLARAKLPVDNWFDRVECAEGIKALDGYQFEWNDKLGRYSNAPLPNWASHGADAWMQYAQGYNAPAEITKRKRRTKDRNWKTR
jgi:hypothetical protein